nr:hypothetical protein [uncultured Rhodopila sp.]
MQYWKQMKSCLVFLTMALVSVAAAPRALAYHEVGAGIDTCATWTSDRQSPAGPPALQDEQWVLGFLTGIGFAGSVADDPLNGVDAAGVWGWIDSYCKQRPEEKLVTAARAFFRSHPH